MTLEPCPFCGCTDHETSPWRTGRKHEWWQCNCGNPDCGAEVGAPTPEGAVARWNRRAHLTQPAQAVDVDFTISDGERRILTWHGDNGCRPATDEETVLWDKLRALSTEKAEGWRVPDEAVEECEKWYVKMDGPSMKSRWSRLRAGITACHTCESSTPSPPHLLTGRNEG